eukprot:1030637-Amphidinium_carterae.2
MEPRQLAIAISWSFFLCVTHCDNLHLSTLQLHWLDNKPLSYRLPTAGQFDIWTMATSRSSIGTQSTILF